MKKHILCGSSCFLDELKKAWIELGGWYETDKTESGWATTKTTEFVSAYAHLINPNEDMAESIAYYILNPDKLRARAQEKYDFIEENIMKGSKYISHKRRSYI
jgi:Trk K+ transport system NAD-binding subunit